MSTEMTIAEQFAVADKYTNRIVNTNIVPKELRGKPEEIFVAVQYGLDIGMKPLQAVQSIAIINGRPCLWGDALLALVRGSGLLEYIHEEVEDDSAVCIVKRKGEPEARREFNRDMAVAAGLWGKNGTWKQYPQRMMQLRARAFALRDVFTDVLAGLQSREEVLDYDDIRDVTPAAERVTPPKPQNVDLKKRIASHVKVVPEPEPTAIAVEPTAVAVEPTAVAVEPGRDWWAGTTFDENVAAGELETRMKSAGTMKALQKIADDISHKIEDPGIVSHLRDIYRVQKRRIAAGEEGHVDQ